MTKFAAPIDIHRELNPLLWQDQVLRPEVHAALMRIAKSFYEFLDIDAKVKDLVISGSQVNYNYTEHSDLDLHLVMDYAQVSCDEPIEELFTAKRKLWNQQHDVDIRGIPVEAGVEDINNPLTSATYSLVKNQWIRRPEQSHVAYNAAEVQRLAAIWARTIQRAMTSGSIEQMQRVRRLLSKYRSLGLKHRGEFGVPNLVFKSLRNSGLLDQLHQTLLNKQDQKLSLD